MGKAAVIFSICVSAALVNASAARADVITPLASIRTVPAAPVEDRPFELVASSTGQGITFAWDLDADGAYDDHVGPAVTQKWPAGSRTVSVRATDGLGRTSTETRSIALSVNVVPALRLSATTRVEIGREYPLTASAWEDDGRIETVEFDVDGDGVYDHTGTAANSWQKEWVGTRNVSFDLPGDHLVRVRVTDDHGATAVATATVRAVESAPSGWLNVNDGIFDKAPVADRPATISAGSLRAAVKYEFDLDGDGGYEVDNGSADTVEATLPAGARVIGARVTDRRGEVLELRNTTFVYQPQDTFVDKMFVRRFETSAVAGEPIVLTAHVEPTSYAYTVEWDADGDGAFDDGSSTTPGGLEPDSSVARTTHTYVAPGTYEQRVRVSRPGVPTRIFTARIFVSAQPVDRTPDYVSFGGVRAAIAGQPFSFDGASVALYGKPVMSFDLDGDGEFDEQPTLDGGIWWWPATTPVTIAGKATDPLTGASSVLTTRVHPTVAKPPVVGFSLPVPGLAVYEGEDGDDCCTAEWDTDGDGEYDDAVGRSAALPTTVGEQSVGLRATNRSGRISSVRKTYRILATGTAPDPPLRGPEPAVAEPRKPKITVKVAKVKLNTLLKKGLKIRATCSTGCRVMATVGVAKSTAKRLKLRSTLVGKGTGNGGVTVKLDNTARKALREVRSVKLKVTVRAVGPDGSVGTTTKTITIRR